ncbi:MAG: bifunctional helix-turn-helix transcriptional regulator/GNAT family N-acetyltransferase [Desulfitobacteriaceae bacterium]
MNSVYLSLVHTIRKFNRFYTNILGLLDQHMLNSEFSLAEIRVLHEIGNTENCTAKKLMEELKMDSGYLSRIIKRFEREKLLYRTQSIDDGRLYYLYLTETGKNTLLNLNELSNNQIYQMIIRLSDKDKMTVVESMKTIETAFTKETVPILKVNIRCDLKPGDVGYVIYLHGWIYAEECGYNHIFEGYVCKTFYDFLENYSPKKDRLWLAEANGEIVGTVAIVGHSPVKAQLRWFIINPAFRGIGLGRALLDEALKYCRENGYKKIFLETTEDQKKAVNMYVKAGFKKVDEFENKAWGKVLIEQTYELIHDCIMD